ncbi:unnamed protein product [Protopolystoma xenopodis]|uniref:Uncharacterized protein n=1 Tax=Protopolystoma xenopodis TaxID=117903 RepID=A0A448XH16_9PLAT|nr:unnamed protein product [Protopolystoma xenopodis]
MLFPTRPAHTWPLSTWDVFLRQAQAIPKADILSVVMFTSCPLLMAPEAKGNCPGQMMKFAAFQHVSVRPRLPDLSPQPSIGWPTRSRHT